MGDCFLNTQQWSGFGFGFGLGYGLGFGFLNTQQCSLISSSRNLTTSGCFEPAGYGLLWDND